MEMRKPLQLTCLLLYASANLFAGVKSDKLKSFPTLRISSDHEMEFRSHFQETIKGTVKVPILYDTAILNIIAAIKTTPDGERWPEMQFFYLPGITGIAINLGHALLQVHIL